MRNKIVSMGHFGPVYARKIQVFVRKALACSPADTWFEYAWSTNAHKTCKSAVEAAKAKHPSMTFKASFAKD